MNSNMNILYVIIFQQEIFIISIERYLLNLSFKDKLYEIHLA